MDRRGHGNRVVHCDDPRVRLPVPPDTQGVG